MESLIHARKLCKWFKIYDIICDRLLMDMVEWRDTLSYLERDEMIYIDPRFINRDDYYSSRHGIIEVDSTFSVEWYNIKDGTTGVLTISPEGWKGTPGCCQSFDYYSVDIEYNTNSSSSDSDYY